MISPSALLQYIESRGVDFFTGVPDSQLQAFCLGLYQTYGEDPKKHIVAVNEGNAVALGAGYHLATGRIPLVYLQNSGLGNAVNPATSLTDPAVYGIPVLYMVGWRGEPGLHDEPQHRKQGEITLDLLEVLGITAVIIDPDSILEGFITHFDTVLYPLLKEGKSVAVVVKKGAFEKPVGSFPQQSSALGREYVIQKLAGATTERDIIVSTTGKISRELFEYRKTSGSAYASHDFLTVGSMGHASAIALSVAIQHPERRVWCFDGDGAALMHMGSLATIGTVHPANLIHVVLNNGSHESVGGMPTVASRVDFDQIVRGAGYQKALRVTQEEQLDECIASCRIAAESPLFVEIVVDSGSRSDLIRPDTTPQHNKRMFMQTLSEER